VRVAQPEAFGDGRRYQVVYRSLFAALSYSGMPPAARRAEAERIRANSADELDLAWADGAEAGVGEYLRWFGEREAYRVSMREFFREWDVLLAPAAIVNAFPHDRRPFHQRTLDVDGQTRPYNDLFTYPGLCNLSGHPGTAFPAAQTPDGLPIGLQAIGPYLEDRTPIRFAELLDEELGIGFRPPPAFA
jgi:amidase